MDILSRVLFFCLSIALCDFFLYLILVGWLVFVGFTADAPRGDRGNGGDGSYRP